MEKINVIIIEDDKKQQDMYVDSFDEFNQTDTEYNIEHLILKDDKELPYHLYHSKCDSIIVDLNWGKDDTENQGNSLIEKLVKDSRIPIFVISADLTKLNPNIEESSLLKIYQRDDDFDICKNIKDLYITGITKAIGIKGNLDKMLNEVFWKHLQPMASSANTTEEQLGEARLLRFVITRINEFLSLREDGMHDDYNPFEFYIIPPIRTSCFTGDIIKVNEKEYFIITPACEIAQGKADYILSCEIDSEQLSEYKGNISNNKKDKLKKFINNNLPRYHLLPPCQEYGGGLVDFQKVVSFSKEELDNVDIIATINQEFSKDIRARFSLFYGRQGQPQLDAVKIIAHMQE